MKFQLKNIFYFSILFLVIALISASIFRYLKHKEINLKDSSVKSNTNSVLKKWGTKNHKEMDISLTLESKLINEVVYFKAKIVLNDKKENDFNKIVIMFFDEDGFIIHTSKIETESENFIDITLLNNQLSGILSWNNKIDITLYNKIKDYDFAIE
jgi:hypothetical protein